MMEAESLIRGSSSDAVNSDGHDSSSKRQRLELTHKSFPSGHFRNHWNLPHIMASSKGNQYAHCKLCKRDLSVADGGHNDTKCHCESYGHLKRLSELQPNSNLSTFIEASSLSHSSKVISAEIAMAQFIDLHNLSFQVADNFSDLVSSIFPDSKIPTDSSFKHTKTRSITTDALDPYSSQVQHVKMEY